MGYMGGTHPALPTYKNMGDHSEVVRVRLAAGGGADELVVVVKRFLEMVDPARPTTRSQYMNAVWCISSGDVDVVRSVLEAWARASKKTCRIPVILAARETFTLAEDYHQKYELRNSRLGKRCGIDLKDGEAVINSREATKWNAVCCGALDGDVFSLTEAERESERQRNEQRA